MISTVSIVGVDHHVCPEYLARISQEYPFVEWALDIKDELFSSDWLNTLIELSDKLRLRGILHDQWNHDMMHGNLSLKVENPSLWDSFQRIQVDNTNDNPHLIDSIQLISDKNIIITNKNEDLDKFNTCLLLPRSYFPHHHYSSCGYSILENDIDFVLGSVEDFWVSVDFSSNPLDLFKVEELLDKVEDSIEPASWMGGLLQMKAVTKRLSNYPVPDNEVESTKI